VREAEEEEEAVGEAEGTWEAEAEGAWEAAGGASGRWARRCSHTCEANHTPP
jgi:hypothetical protein